MKHKFHSRLIYFWALLNISNGITTFDSDLEQPFWKSFLPCAIDLPLVRFCDPDNTLTKDEIQVLSSSMQSCSEKMTSKANDTQVVMIAFESIPIGGNQTFANIDQLLTHLTTHWSPFLTYPMYIAIAVKESGEVRDCRSDSAEQMGCLEHHWQPGQSFQEQLGSKEQNFFTTLTKVQDVMCNTVLFWGSPDDSLTSVLWIILSTILILGSFTFGCWIYRFNKSHPTTDETDNYEMTQDVYYDEDGNPLQTICSGFVLSQNDIEAASPDPTKSTTHEALDRI